MKKTVLIAFFTLFGLTVSAHDYYNGPDVNYVCNGSLSGGLNSLRNVSLIQGSRDRATMPTLLNFNSGAYYNDEYVYEEDYESSSVCIRKFPAEDNRPKLNINGTESGDINTYQGYMGGIVAYAIEADVIFEVVNNASWIRVKTRGIDRFEIFIEENPYGYGRNDSLILRVPGKQRTIYVQQSGRALNPTPEQDTESTPDSVSEPKAKGMFNISASFLITSTSANFSSKLVTQSIINYGVNDLNGSYSDPDYQSGIGFNVQVHYYIPLSSRFYLVPGLGISNGGFTNNFKSHDWYYRIGGTDRWWHPEQTSKETYRLTYLDIPIKAAFKIPFGNSSNGLMLKGGFVIGYGLSGTCEVESSVYEWSDDGYIRNCNITGSVNLFTGKYKFIQEYSTGQANSYAATGNAKNPYNRMNFSLTLGTDLLLGHFSIGVSYNIGLSNIANSKYWKYPEYQVPGFFLAGDVPGFVNNVESLKGYSQSLQSFAATVSFSF